MYHSDKFSHCRSRSISTRWLPTQNPALAAIMSHSRSFFRFFRRLIIASEDHPVLIAPEQQREYALTRRSMNDRRFRHCPVQPAIAGMKYPRRRPSSTEPDILFPVGRNARPARGESAFIGQRRRHTFDCHRRPGCAVAGRDQREFSIDGIAHGDPVLAVPERKAVVERPGIFVGELELPALAAVGCLVNPRLL